MIIYECGICGAYHPWEFDGDCRDDDNRWDGPDEYAAYLDMNKDDIEVRTMEERVEADILGR